MCGFSLPDFWLRKSEPTLAQGTGELVAPPDLSHLALLARLYHGVEATSCKRSATFLPSVLISTLWASMNPFKVEQMMFLKASQGCLPEVQKYNAAMAALQDAANASSMCNRHKRLLLGRRWMSKYRRVGTKR